jgi:hypothetical protein
MSREHFDSMSDAEFAAWWDAKVERVQAEATDEAEVEAVCAARAAAQEERGGR